MLVAGFGVSLAQRAAKPPTKRRREAARVLRRAEERRDGDEPAAHEVRRPRASRSPRCRRATSRRRTSGHGALSRRRRSDCLPAGKTIVKGTPSWVHFGDGKDVFDTQLTPGKHKLALQLGDDLHNTLPGTCQEITVTVK